MALDQGRVGPTRRPVGGTETRRILEVLDADGDSRQRTRVFASGDRLVDGRRSIEGRLAVDGHEGIELRVVLLDAGDSMAHQLSGGQLPTPNLLDQSADRLTAEVHAGEITAVRRSEARWCSRRGL